MLGIYIRYNAVRARKARGKKEINRNHVDGIANKLSNLYICANKKTNLLKSDTFTHAMIYLIYIPRYFRGRKIILPIALTWSYLTCDLCFRPGGKSGCLSDKHIMALPRKVIRPITNYDEIIERWNRRRKELKTLTPSKIPEYFIASFRRSSARTSGSKSLAISPQTQFVIACTAVVAGKC